MNQFTDLSSGLQEAALNRLRRLLESAFRAAIGSSRDCAVLDFPSHANVGDSAIWAGQMELLHGMQVRVRYAASRGEFSLEQMRRRLPSDGVVLIHGGGNFGTLYPSHQAHREALLRECRDLKIVQLPQSLRYEDAAAVAHTADLVAKHPDFTLLVRDQASLQIGTQELKARTLLCPDSALALAGRLKREAPRVDCLVLARGDKERAGHDLSKEIAQCADGMSIQVCDWLEEPASAPFMRSQWTRSKLRRTAYRFSLCEEWMARSYESTASARVARGVRLLSLGKVVITDRLHGMILCAAAGIPCVALDNNYGKVSGFYRQWLEEVPGCTIATDVKHAVEAAAGLLVRVDSSAACATDTA